MIHPLTFHVTTGDRLAELPPIAVSPNAIVPIIATVAAATSKMISLFIKSTS